MKMVLVPFPGFGVYTSSRSFVNYMTVCVCEGTRLAAPWHCPESSCDFTTDVRRARAAHLLRSHHLLFQGHGKEPLPLNGQELQERLEAFRRRNRGGKQRARENRRAAVASSRVGGGSPTPLLSEDPVAGSVAYPDPMLEENWEESVEVLLEEDLGAVLAACENKSDWQLVPYSSKPTTMDEEILPKGIPVSEFAYKVSSWRGLSVEHVLLKARAEWGIADEDLPRLMLALRLVLSSRMNTAFNLLETFQPMLQTTPEAIELCRSMLEEVVLLASGQ